MAGQTMLAVQYRGYGGGVAALKHVEVPIPSPKKDEVLLKLEAASINPVDWKIQKGMIRPFLPPKFPFIPVSDVAGEVSDVGSAVKDFKAGDKVVSMLTLKNGGGLAQYAVAPSNLTVHRPAEVSPADGAGLPIAACTALQALKSGGAKFDGTGKPLNVLITAASGGVGLYAVQLAKLVDLHVTATCGARNIELLRSLGVDEVLDYKSPEGAKLKSPSGKKYDAVIHCTVGIVWSTFEPNLSDNGKVIDITPSPFTFLNSAIKKLTFAKKKIVPLLSVPNKEDLQFLVGLVKEGKLKTVVDSKYPLSNAEEAWAKSIDGHATVTDVAGEVIEVGSAVKNFKVGDKVVSMLIFMKGGGLAEYAVASSSLTVHRPPEVSPAEGAGLPIAASTALQALKSAGAKFDGTNKPFNILITAASGGVGHYALQLAKLANLHVTATCGARNIDLVKSLGADEVLDYNSPDGAILHSPSGKKYDAVIQCTTGVEWSVFEPNLNENGKVVVVTPNPMTFVKSALKKLTCAKKKAVPMVLMPKEEDLQFLVGLVKEGKMKTVVDSRHLLSNAEDAWVKCMDGHATGKIIIEM